MTASTGNVCTVRCINPQDFGGCFVVQQTDITPNANTPANIATAQTLSGVLAQVAQNQVDLPAAIKGNQEATLGTDADQGVKQVDNLLNIDSVAQATAGAAGTAVATSSAAAAKSTKAAKGSTAKGSTAKASTAKASTANGAAAKGGKNANRARAPRVFIS